eukprot:1142565-Pelagomonas_calceolata.AAC.4
MLAGVNPALLNIVKALFFMVKDAKWVCSRGLGVEALGQGRRCLGWGGRGRSLFANWIVSACWVARLREKEFVNCFFLKSQDWVDY